MRHITSTVRVKYAFVMTINRLGTIRSTLVFPDKTSGPPVLSAYCSTTCSSCPALCTESGTFFTIRWKNPCLDTPAYICISFCAFPLNWIVVNQLTSPAPQGSLLTGAQLLGLAVFVVHLHASAIHQPMVQLVPPTSTELVNFGDVFDLALICNTRTNMIFCLRWGFRFELTW